MRESRLTICSRSFMLRYSRRMTATRDNIKAVNTLKM